VEAKDTPNQTSTVIPNSEFINKGFLGSVGGVAFLKTETEIAVVERERIGLRESMY